MSSRINDAHGNSGKVPRVLTALKKRIVHVGREKHVAHLCVQGARKQCGVHLQVHAHKHTYLHVRTHAPSNNPELSTTSIHSKFESAFALWCKPVKVSKHFKLP